ncbi:hypothetical protein ACFWF7_29730 [Nocardia sp. NPDC060256]|uniref:hypothetical protein n=1 Tax=unclassified Nocardia TaxID=2637762 RepID=UPI00365780C4
MRFDSAVARTARGAALAAIVLTAGVGTAGASPTTDSELSKPVVVCTDAEEAAGATGNTADDATAQQCHATRAKSMAVRLCVQNGVVAEAKKEELSPDVKKADNDICKKAVARADAAAAATSAAGAIGAASGDATDDYESAEIDAMVVKYEQAVADAKTPEDLVWATSYAANAAMLAAESAGARDVQKNQAADAAERRAVEALKKDGWKPPQG